MEEQRVDELEGSGKVKKILRTDFSEKKEAAEEGKCRVAAYCRVSSGMEGQQTSFDMQVKVYREKIAANPEWVFAGIYADEGITGTSIKKRNGFRRMIADCEAGKIDYIITKSISRFARNTLECLSCIRYLQSLGVQLLFEKENIDTGTAFSEMLLTILAAFAQEESRSISENLKWGIRKRFQNGVDRWVCVYGYTKNEKGKYQIVPQEADVVRKIYELYERGFSIMEITEYLWRHHIPSPQGKERWRTSAVHMILRNEKYVGDIMLQKKYTIDHISHKEVRNDCTEIPAYYIENHHTPLITRQTYERVQKIRKMKCQGKKNEQGSGHSVQYPFGELLRCPYCGSILYQRMLPIQHRGQGWCCEKGETACHRFIIRSEYVESAVLRAYQELDLEAIRKKQQSKRKKTAEAAKRMAGIKEVHPSFQKAEYYWLDELVDHIVFGTHQKSLGEVQKEEKKSKGKRGEYTAGDNTMTVFWKCGIKTTVETGIEKEKDRPQNLVRLYQACLKRKAAGQTVQDSDTEKKKGHSNEDYLHTKKIQTGKKARGRLLQSIHGNGFSG